MNCVNRISRSALALLLLLIPLRLALAQGYNSFQKLTFTTAATGGQIKQNGLSAYHVLSWTVSGVVSSCSVEMDTSTDGVSWSLGALIAAQDCHTTGSYSASATANYVRVGVLVLTGGGTVTTTYKGYAQGITNPTFTFSLPNPAVADSGLYHHKLSVDATVARLSCSVDQGTASISLDVRPEANPNTDTGTHVLTSPLTCTTSTGTTTVFDRPSYTAYQVLALVITGTSGSPSTLNVHVVMVPQ